MNWLGSFRGWWLVTIVPLQSKFSSHNVDETMTWKHLISKWAKVMFIVTSSFCAKTLLLIIQHCDSRTTKGGCDHISCNLTGWQRHTTMTRKFWFSVDAIVWKWPWISAGTWKEHEWQIENEGLSEHKRENGKANKWWQRKWQGRGKQEPESKTEKKCLSRQYKEELKYAMQSLFTFFPPVFLFTQYNAAQLN